MRRDLLFQIANDTVSSHLVHTDWYIFSHYQAAPSTYHLEQWISWWSLPLKGHFILRELNFWATFWCGTVSQSKVLLCPAQTQRVEWEVPTSPHVPNESGVPVSPGSWTLPGRHVSEHLLLCWLSTRRSWLHSSVGETTPPKKKKSMKREW